MLFVSYLLTTESSIVGNLLAFVDGESEYSAMLLLLLNFADTYVIGTPINDLLALCPGLVSGGVERIEAMPSFFFLFRTGAYFTGAYLSFVVPPLSIAVLDCP